MHSLRRTNPFGEEFIGTCYKCGAEGLPMGDMSECPNVRNLSPEEDLLEALEIGEEQSRRGPEANQPGDQK